MTVRWRYIASTVEFLVRQCMANVRKTILLTDQQDGWIKSQIDAGRYTNDSEFIRELIRHERERNADIEAVRVTLIEGENSGEPVAFNLGAFKHRMHAQHG
jgi:antitoxin ParD1/3/4